MTKIITGAGGKLYTVCPYCRTLVRLDKPLVGSLHLCVTDEERQQIAKAQE